MRACAAVLILVSLLHCRAEGECSVADASCDPAAWLLFARTLRARFLLVANNAGASMSAFRINDSTGQLTPLSGSPFTVGTQPQVPVVDPSSQFIYVANIGSGNLHAFSIEAQSGAVSAISGSPVSGFNQPLAPAIDSRSRFMYVSNNNAGQMVSALRISSSGSLSALTSVSAGTQPSNPVVDVFDRFVFIGDYSGTNAVYPYRINQTDGSLTAAATAGYNATSSLPTLDPGGRLLYMVNTAASALLYSFTIDSQTGGLTTVDQDPGTGGVQGVGLLGPPAPNPPRAAVTPDGRFLYIANTSNAWASVSSYSVNTTTGIITQIAGSPFATAGDGVQLPAVHPSGRFLYVSNSAVSNINVYHINPISGALTSAGSPVATGTGPGPVIVDPGGSFAFVPNYNAGAGNTISVFTINAATGALTQVAGSPYAVGTGPLGMSFVSYYVY